MIDLDLMDILSNGIINNSNLGNSTLSKQGPTLSCNERIELQIQMLNYIKSYLDAGMVSEVEIIQVMDEVNKGTISAMAKLCKFSNTGTDSKISPKMTRR